MAKHCWRRFKFHKWSPTLRYVGKMIALDDAEGWVEYEKTCLECGTKEIVYFDPCDVSVAGRFPAEINKQTLAAVPPPLVDDEDYEGGPYNRHPKYPPGKD